MAVVQKVRPDTNVWGEGEVSWLESERIGGPIRVGRVGASAIPSTAPGGCGPASVTLDSPPPRGSRRH